MKRCIKCGKKIVYGVNGCSMLNDCFDCRGGYPDYSRNKSNFKKMDDGAADYWEGRILARQETYND